MDGWDTGMWALVAGLVAVVISVVGALISASAKKEAISLATVKDTLSPIHTVIAEAEGWVAAAEQLWKNTEIPELEDGQKDPRFYWVLDNVRRFLPDIDDATLEAGIEAAVRFAKAGLVKLESTPTEGIAVKPGGGGEFFAGTFVDAR